MRRDRERDGLRAQQVLLGESRRVLLDRPEAGQRRRCSRRAARCAALTGSTRSIEASSSTSRSISTYAASPFLLMNRSSCVSRIPGDPGDAGDLQGRERAWSRWRPGTPADVASASGSVDRNSATNAVRPPPKSASRRSATWADSEVGSSQPPVVRLLDGARRERAEGAGGDDRERDDPATAAIDEGAPAGEHGRLRLDQRRRRPTARRCPSDRDRDRAVLLGVLGEASRNVARSMPGTSPTTLMTGSSSPSSRRRRVVEGDRRLTLRASSPACRSCASRAREGHREARRRAPRRAAPRGRSCRCAAPVRAAQRDRHAGRRRRSRRSRSCPQPVSRSPFQVTFAVRTSAIESLLGCVRVAR